MTIWLYVYNISLLLSSTTMTAEMLQGQLQQSAVLHPFQRVRHETQMPWQWQRKAIKSYIDIDIEQKNKYK